MLRRRSRPEQGRGNAALLVLAVLGLGLTLLGGWWWARTSARASFPAGTLLAPLPVSEDGRELVWSVTPGRPALVLAFSATCEHCEELASSWRELLERIRAAPETGRAVDVVLLSADEPREARAFLERHGLEGRLLQTGELPESWAEHLVRAPQTILVDAHGRVQRALVGPWKPSEVEGWRELVRASEVAPAAHGER